MHNASALPERRVVLDLAFDPERLSRERAAWSGRLHYIALSAHPVGTSVAGLHRVELDGGAATLDLLIGDPEKTLTEVRARVDHFILPAGAVANRLLGRMAAPHATLQAEDADDEKRRALRAAGFSWDEGQQGPWLHARYTSQRPHPPEAAPPSKRAVVIGAGLAGAAACERLCARGWQVTLIERHEAPAQEASGNRAGIFMPLLSKDDNIPTRLARAAFLYALRRWQALGGLGAAINGAQCGVLQLARDADHAALQEELAGQWSYPPDFVQWLDAEAASSKLGSPTPYGAWLFPQGGWATPASICAAMLADCRDKLERRFHAEAVRLERHGEEWRVLAADGSMIAQAPDVVIANGAGAMELPQTAPLPLYTMRGQVTHLNEGEFPTLSLVVCREAYMTPPVGGIVSVGATYDTGRDAALRDASQQENLERAEEILGHDRIAARRTGTPPLQGRVGFRCMAPDRLPLVGTLPDYGALNKPERARDVQRHPGLHCLLGYASRGLIWAPLAAELLVSQLEGEALPLEASLAAALDPARFLLKNRRRTVADAP